MKDFHISKSDLEYILNSVINKTLGEVDTAGVFRKTEEHPKITGIAGDVIEQSVLGYPANSNQAPDLIVNGEEIELKTTGIRYSKKEKNRFEAKEPMTITAVSPKTIINQSFESSHFWNKIEKLLLVYYHYDSSETVTAADYAEFQIKGFEIFEFPEEERKILENDWHLVKNYIKNLHETTENPEEGYRKLSSDLRDKLMFIDTSPKWPNPPRFRLKRSVVSSMVDRYFRKRLNDIEEEIKSFEEFDEILKNITLCYKNKSIDEIVDLLNIDVKKSKTNNDYSKSIGEKIVLAMFGSSEKKLSKVKLFKEIGLVGKTVVQTSTEYHAEDTKLGPIDFDEWCDKNMEFENSTLYSYFTNPFLFILFEQPSKDSPLSQNIFKGFKRIHFSDDFIFNDVKATWEKVRHLIFNDELVDVQETDKYGIPKINKTGVARSAPNFPKAKYNNVFIRGTGNNSTKKSVTVNNVKMYKQNVWIKGEVLNHLLKNHDYL